MGLGAALNVALDHSRAPYIAYLPSDDLYDPDHLEVLVRSLVGADRAVLAWSDLRPPTPRSHESRPWPQLVQVMHRRTGDQWLERAELETDDLEALFWNRLRRRGISVGTGRATCVWRQHEDQRHRRIRESLDGGLNVFRSRYRVAQPLRFRSSDGGLIDEPTLYEPFRRIPTPPTNGLKILLVGELAYNPERVLAFVERGHRLYGLWTHEPLADHSVGPLPFGHVEDVDPRGWRDEVERIRPDLVYALLNWRAVRTAHMVLGAKLGVPFVWHFKESPMRCVERGTWDHLVDLQTKSDGQVYSTPLERDWFDVVLPGARDGETSLVLDGDLPTTHWFSGATSPRRSGSDGEVHTFVLGRPLGIDLEVVQRLARAGIHLHMYGPVRGRGPGAQWTTWIDDARRTAPHHVHLHAHIDRRNWVQELSRFDAGWLHRFVSSNDGDLRKATWDDLNYPSRIPAMMAAGVPLLQSRNPGCRVAAEELVRERGIGILYRDLDDLCAQLHDAHTLQRARRAVANQRHEFAFDHHVERLIDLFRRLLR